MPCVLTVNLFIRTRAMETLTLKNELNSISSEDELSEWLDALCAAVGALYFDFTVYYPESIQKTRKVQFTSYEQEWQQALCSEQLKHANPFLEHCLSSTIPVVWSSLECSGKYKADKYTHFIEQARIHGLYDGVSATARGSGSKFGILNINGLEDDAPTAVEELITTTQAILPYLFEKSLTLTHEQESKPSLTARERECVAWACEGKTSWEISKILGLSERTVIFHMTNCIRKTQTSNRQQAIAKSILNGYVCPSI